MVADRRSFITSWIIIDYFVVYRSLGCGVKSAHRSFKP